MWEVIITESTIEQTTDVDNYKIKVQESLFTAVSLGSGSLWTIYILHKVASHLIK